MNKKRYLLLFIILTITLPFFYFWFLFYEIKNNFKFFCYNEWVIELYSKDYKNTLKKWNIYEVKSYKWEFKSSTWEYLYEIYINNWDIKSKNYKNITYYSSGSIMAISHFAMLGYLQTSK